MVYTMQSSVGKLQHGERFYLDGYRLPFTVINPSHNMGVKVKHPRKKQHSYLSVNKPVDVDLSTVDILTLALR